MEGFWSVGKDSTHHGKSVTDSPVLHKLVGKTKTWLLDQLGIDVPFMKPEHIEKVVR